MCALGATREGTPLPSAMSNTEITQTTLKPRAALKEASLPSTMCDTETAGTMGGL